MLTNEAVRHCDPQTSKYSFTLPDKSGIRMAVVPQVAPDEERLKLRDILVSKSVKLDRVFTLSSGATSNQYIDAKLTTCSPEAMKLVGRVFLRKIQECGWSPNAVGGLTVGADPIAFSVARESDEVAAPIHAFIVRKAPKPHGMQRFIEGLENTDGLPVVVIDDVCTKGNSTGEAIEKARQAGMKVLGAICLVDREEGAEQLLADKYACRLVGVFTLAELVDRKMSTHTVDRVVTSA